MTNKDKPEGLDLLRSTGPHLGLASLSGELFAVWVTLPRAQRTALAFRDTHPGMGEEALTAGIALALLRDEVTPLPWGEAMTAARQAVQETRGILDPINGKVTR